MACTGTQGVGSSDTGGQVESEKKLQFCLTLQFLNMSS